MKLLLPVFALVLTLGACSERTIAPPSGNEPVAFELVLPRFPAANYLAVSGIRVVTDEVIVDTIINRTGRDLFAQFTAASGVIVPQRVELNDNVLTRSGGTDTLRLNFAASTDLFGIHRWEVSDSLGSPDAFSVAPVDIIDSVSPFFEQLPIRPDTALVLRWKPPTSASSGVLITWRAPGVAEYKQVVVDNGRATIPADSVYRFRGEEGELILTRFRSGQQTLRSGRTVQVVRVAQRNYKTRVAG